MATASLSVNSASKTSANISFSTSGWSLPPNDTKTNTSSSDNTTTVTTTTTTYKDLKYTWSFGDGGSSSSQSGTRNYNGLQAGQKNNITGKVKVTCTKVVQTNTKTTTVTPGAEGKPPTTSTTTHTGTPTTTTIELSGSPLSAQAKTAYTQPNQLSWSVSVGDYLEDELTVTNWNRLIDQLGKYRSYKDKADKYDDYNSLKVSVGTLVTASIFNQVASACGIGNVAQTGKDITATAVNSLVNAVNRS